MTIEPKIPDDITAQHPTVKVMAKMLSRSTCSNTMAAMRVLHEQGPSAQLYAALQSAMSSIACAAAALDRLNGLTEPRREPDRSSGLAVVAWINAELSNEETTDAPNATEVRIPVEGMTPDGFVEPASYVVNGPLHLSKAAKAEIEKRGTLPTEIDLGTKNAN